MKLLRRLYCIFFLALSSAIASSQCCSNGVNLLASYNPDFSIPGNPVPPGFETDNIYSSFLGSGLYSVVVSRNYGACWSTPQFDHTFGDESGDYLWFDTGGSASAMNPEVAWKPFDPNRPSGQENTLDVEQGTTYVFSAWVRDLAREGDCINGGAPIMGLRINGVDMAEIDLGDFTSPCCPEWVYFCTEWNSGNATQVSIQIESRSGIGWTDLGIDDVYFGTTSPLQNNILGPDITVCAPQDVALVSNLTSGSIVWSTGATTPDIEVNNGGIYWVEVDEGGCISRDSISVSIIQDLPQVSIGPDLTACLGDVVTLSYSANQQGNALWNTGSTSTAIQIAEPGTYSITFSNDCGTDQDDVQVFFDQPPSFNITTSDNDLCDGESALLEVVPNSTLSVVWSTGQIGQSILVNTAGLYIAELTNSCGIASESITITDGVAPIVELGPDITICEGSETILSTTETQVDYLWSTGETGTSIFVDALGIYVLTVTNDCGSAQDEVEVFVDQQPVFSVISSDILLCDGETALLEVISNNSSPIIWSTGETGQSITVSASGVYSAELSNICGITLETVIIAQGSTPSVMLGADITVCEGTNVVLETPSDQGSYLWNTGTTNASISVNTSGVYSVEVTNDCGFSEDLIVVEFVAPLLIELGEDITACDGTQVELAIDAPNAQIQWSTGGTTASIFIEESGIYQVQATDVCVVSDAISISFLEAPSVSLPDSMLICPNVQSVVDAGSGPFFYDWSNDSTSSSIIVGDEEFVWVRKFNICGEVSDTVIFERPSIMSLPMLNDTTLCLDESFEIVLDSTVTPFLWEDGSFASTRLIGQAGIYSLTTTNACESLSESFEVSIKECNCVLFVPNTFTPNLDGYNDVLKVETECSFDLFRWTIYNSWGEAFFTTQNPEDVWTGGDTDYYVPDGIYSYILEYKFSEENSRRINGFVLVIR